MIAAFGQPTNPTHIQHMPRYQDEYFADLRIFLRSVLGEHYDGPAAQTA